MAYHQIISNHTGLVLSIKGGEKVELDERKIVILKAIVKSYLETGEPAGSRTIAKLCGLNLSSATIRNEMSDLVDMGYLAQPHTSAGRVPTDKGYRFYIDSIMDEYSENLSSVTSQMSHRIDKLEKLLKDLVRMIAQDTSYAALISGPGTGNTRIKYIQLSVSSPGQLLMSLVLDGNVIKNEFLEMVEEMDQRSASELALMINNHLCGLTLKEITPRLITEMMVQSGTDQGNVKLILDAIVDSLTRGESDPDIYTSGAKNLFKYPELADAGKAVELAGIFEEEDVLKDILSEAAPSKGSKGGGHLRVYLGGEGPVKDMRDYSLIAADYELGDGMKGVIGVIGPKRMNYEKVVKALNNLGSQMRDAFHDEDIKKIESPPEPKKIPFRVKNKKTEDKS